MRDEARTQTPTRSTQPQGTCIRRRDCRLRALGYSCEAIWEVLVEAGLAVSRSSVKREVLRLARRGPTTATRALAVPSQGQVVTAQGAASSARTNSRSLPGQEFAAEWMDRQIINPLFARSSP